jgi:regulator of protease activity HflC (stomatin/prohibitin superfamily)
LATTNYREAIDRAAQTSLREMIGSSMQIRDVAIPEALQDAMSRQAQAEREKQARVILGSAEAAIAGKFVKAAAIYASHPWALQLRAMNGIYETTKEREATILMPSSMVDSLNPSAATLPFALAGHGALETTQPQPVTAK